MSESTNGTAGVDADAAAVSLPILQVFRGHALVYMGSNLVPAFLGFASVFVFVRLFGTATYGKFGVGVGVALTGASYGVGWIVQGILRFQRQAELADKSRRFAETAGTLALLATCVAAAVGGVLLVRIPEADGALVIMSLAVLMSAAGYQVLFAAIQSSLAPKKLLWAETTKATLFVLLPIGLLKLAGIHGTAPLLGGMLCGYSAGAAILWSPHVRLGAVDGITARKLWDYGWPIGLWLGCSQMLTYTDRYLIAHYYGYDTAGAYASVFDLVRKGFIVALSPITLAVHPLLVRLWTENRPTEVRTVLRHAMAWQLGLGIFGIVVLLFASPFLGQLLLHEKADQVHGMIAPIALGSVLWTAALLAHKPLELRMRTRTMLVLLMAASALTLLLDVTLLPRFGPIAAAYATVAGSGSYLAMVWIVLLRGEE